jgi:hypothetical protein
MASPAGALVTRPDGNALVCLMKGAHWRTRVVRAFRWVVGYDAAAGGCGVVFCRKSVSLALARDRRAAASRTHSHEPRAAGDEERPLRE